jgi:hypothetical protein
MEKYNSDSLYNSADARAHTLGENHRAAKFFCRPVLSLGVTVWQEQLLSATL